MPNQNQAAEADESLLLEIAELIVTAVNLDIPATEIESDAPLFGEGLGLDSIDILEISLVLSKQYGIQLRSDSNDNISIFGSLRSLSAHVAEHRTK